MYKETINNLNTIKFRLKRGEKVFNKVKYIYSIQMKSRGGSVVIYYIYLFTILVFSDYKYSELAYQQKK